LMQVNPRIAPNRGKDCADWGKSVIRQAISCDICGSEKRQTNHWFVAYDQGGELRVAGWSSRNRLRPGSKHLCGQTCLHKLVDEFMAKAISGRAQAVGDELDLPERIADRTADRSSDRSAEFRPGRAPDRTIGREVASDGFVAAGPIYEDGESSARLIKPASPAASATPRPLPFRAHPELVPPSGRPQASPESPLPSSHPAPHPASYPGSLPGPAAASDSAPRFSSRQWRAEAWNRERNRELRNGKADSSITIRRRAGS
jgi:hypothetical protein